MENLLETQSAGPGLMAGFRAYPFRCLAAFAAVVAGTVGLTAVSEREYTSTAKLQVQVNRDSVVLDPAATIRPYMGAPDTRQVEIQAIEEILSGRNVLAKVVKEFDAASFIGEEKESPFAKFSWMEKYNLDPLKVYDFEAKAIKKIKRNLKIAIPKESKVITLSFTAKDPLLAQKVLDFIIAQVRDEHIRVNRSEGSHDFFAKESKRLGDDVRKLERELAELKSSSGVSSYEAQRTIHLDQIARLEDQIVRTTARLVAVEAEIKSRAAELANMPAMLVTEEVTDAPNSLNSELKVETFKLQIREQELASKYNDDNVQLLQVREQLKKLQQVVQNEANQRQVKRSVNENRDKYELALREREAEQVALKTEAEQYKADLETARRRMDSLNSVEPLLREKERSVALADAAYRRYQETFEISKIEEHREAQKLSNINVSQAPSFSEQPVNPDIKINGAIGFVLASLSSIAAALWGGRRLASDSAAGMTASRDIRVQATPVSRDSLPTLLDL